MNVKQILTIFVISILMFFSGCNSLKRRIVVGQEKVEYYVIVCYFILFLIFLTKLICF